MDERKYRRLFTQFLNDYWGAFHEVLEAQSVNPRMLAGSLFDALVDAHDRFAILADGSIPHLVALGKLWEHIAERRREQPDAPLIGREVDYGRAQFEMIFDALSARGRLYPLASNAALAAAAHGTPRMRLRADAAS
jgi:hypothetical protein